MSHVTGSRLARLARSARVIRALALATATILVALAAMDVLPVSALQRRSATDAVEVRPPSSVAAVATAEELGALLFFDPRISGDAQVSCSSCHLPDQAWSDGMALSAGYTSTLYFRNTPTLLNASQMPVLDWDGRFEQSDMTSLVRDHLTEAHFMNVDGRLMVERLRQLSALAAFVGPLASEDHPYQRYLDGDSSALSPQARAGLRLFAGKAGCAQCHSGPLLSDGELRSLGVPENVDIFQEPLRHITFRRFFRAFGVGEYVTMRDDPGLYALTFNDADRGAFRTPSLLEVARTAPYMHNGVFDDLEDVVRFYDDGGGDGSSLRPLGLTADEIASLVAFLDSLQSEQAPFETPELPPYGLRTLGEN